MLWLSGGHLDKGIPLYYFCFLQWIYFYGHYNGTKMCSLHSHCGSSVWCVKMGNDQFIWAVWVTMISSSGRQLSTCRLSVLPWRWSCLDFVRFRFVWVDSGNRFVLIWSSQKKVSRIFTFYSYGIPIDGQPQPSALMACSLHVIQDPPPKWLSCTPTI